MASVAIVIALQSPGFQSSTAVRCGLESGGRLSPKVAVARRATRVSFCETDCDFRRKSPTRKNHWVERGNPPGATTLSTHEPSTAERHARLFPSFGSAA